MDFVKKYLASVFALLIMLIVLFFLLNLLGKKLPGAAGAVVDKAGALASGQQYQFAQ